MGDAEELGLIEDESGTDVAEGEGGGGDEGAEETPAEEELPEGEGGEGAEEEPAESPDETEEDRASRTLPTQLRRALREINQINPEFAKKFPRLERQLTAALFKASQADRFGGFQKIRGAMEALETHGGPEGIQAMAEEVEATHMLEEGFSQGDPVLIDTWSKEYPDGFKLLVGPAIEKLEALDLAAHDRALSGPMFKTLDRCGVIGTVADLEAAIAGERFEDIQKHFTALKNFLVDLRSFANKAKAPDPLKSEREKIAAERTEIQSERVKTFQSGVRNAVNSQELQWTNRLLRQELAGRKLRLETANRVRKQIHDDLVNAVNGAPGYIDKYKAIMQTGNHDQAVRFIVSSARQKLPMVVKRVLRDFNLGKASGNGTATGPRRVATSGGARAAGSSVVAGRPKTADVDFTRVDKARWLGMISSGHGEVRLRNGKTAKW